MVAGVAVGDVDLFGSASSFAGVVLAVQMERGGVQVDALRGNAKTLGGFASDSDEEFGEACLKEFVQYPPQPTSLRCSGLILTPSRCSVALPQKNSSNRYKGEETQTAEDHGLHGLPGANVLLGMGTKLPVDLFYQTDLIYDAGDYAQVIDVLYFYAWSLPRFIHGSIKYLSSYSYLRNTGCVK